MPDLCDKQSEWKSESNRLVRVVIVCLGWNSYHIKDLEFCSEWDYEALDGFEKASGAV